MTPEEEPTDNRLSNGRFAPGHSGNPTGRPKCATAELRERLATSGDEVADLVVKKALEGDMGAARLVLERVLPPLKSNAAPVSVDLPPTSSPLALAGAFIAAAARGELPPDVATQLVSATAQLSRVAETEELRQRLEAIERAMKPQKSK